MAKLMIEENFDIEIITEGKSKTPSKIAGVFSTADVMVANGRKYPKYILERETNKINEKIEDRRCLGELNHPKDIQINLDKVCILIEKIEWKDNNIWGCAKILNTPNGKIVKELIRECKIGISSRGLGTVNEDTKEVNDDFNLITWDIVGNPSNNGSWINGIYEEKEFYLENEYKKSDNTLIEEYLILHNNNYINSIKHLKEDNKLNAAKILENIYMNKFIRK